MAAEKLPTQATGANIRSAIANHADLIDALDVSISENTEQIELVSEVAESANTTAGNALNGLTTKADLVSGKVPASQLPAYVDDVLEFANLAALPTTGETGKIYVTLDTNYEYRWSGSTYVRLVASPGSTDAVPEGTTNKYYTDARVASAPSVINKVLQSDYNTAIASKVDKDGAKVLSTNDYTNTEKAKVAATSGTNTGDVPLEGALVSNPDWAGGIQKAPLTGGRTRVKRIIGKRVLGNFSVKAGLNSPPATVTDVTTTDAMYGLTALQVNLATNTEVQFAPSAALTTGVNVTDGIIRLWFKPIANVFNGLNKFSIELHSAGTPSAVTANFHQLNAFGAPSDLNQRLTSATGTGRWQCYSVAVNNFILAGTGADLTSIKFARLILRSPGATTVLQIGNIEFVPNQFTKAKCILSFDDGFQSQLTYAAAQMAKYGFPGVLFPSPITTTIGIDSDRLTPTQIKNMHDNLGWQIGSQSWSTESNTIVDAMTEDQFTSEVSRIRNWQKSLGITGGEHGSYFSNVGPTDMIAYPTFRKHFRSMRTFFEGATAIPPFQIGETLPFGDPMAVRAINGATTAWATNTSSQLQAHVDQAITNKGIAYFIWHNDLATAGNARTGFDSLLAYLDANRATIDVVTEDDLY